MEAAFKSSSFFWDLIANGSFVRSEFGEEKEERQVGVGSSFTFLLVDGRRGISGLFR